MSIMYCVFFSVLLLITAMSLATIIVAVQKRIGEDKTKEKRLNRRLIAGVCAAFFLFCGIAKIAKAEQEDIEYFVVEEIVGVTAVDFDGEVTYKIDFVFHNDILSWYEDEPVHSGRTYVLKIWCGVEVVNSAWL